MKHIKLILSLFVITMTVACKQSSPVATTPMQSPTTQPSNEFAGKTFDLPCLGVSKSDNEYFRQLGIGEDLDLSNAQEKALDNAKNLMKKRLGERVKGLATNYSKTVSKSNKSSDFGRILEQELTGVVDGVLNDADNECEAPAQLNSGAYRYYYVVRIKKGTLADKFAEAIDQNEALKLEYDREKFRKYASEYLKDQQ